jgi:hypothetical protein
MVLENPFGNLIPKRWISLYHISDYCSGFVIIPLVATRKPVYTVDTRTRAYNKSPIAMLVPTLKFRMLTLRADVCCNF